MHLFTNHHFDPEDTLLGKTTSYSSVPGETEISTIMYISLAYPLVPVHKSA
jgi:hypothetical protein